MHNSGVASLSSENAPIEIGFVERETGVPKETLRIWERRYGFPTPARSVAGRREYSGSDVIKLRLVKRLIDQGHRPKALVSQPVAALRALLDNATVQAREAASGQPPFRLPSELLNDGNVGNLSRWIAAAAERLDARSFILDCVRPLYRKIGEAWAETRLSICCEHLITEQLQSILRQTIANASYSAFRPKILLTTPPGEKHGLGLLMVQALLSCDGVACVSLGTETPVDEIAKCAEFVGADIVALSISRSFGKREGARFLLALRNVLPPDLDIWAGGAGVSEFAKPMIGVTFLRELESVPMALASSLIRANHAPPK